MLYARIRFPTQKTSMGKAQAAPFTVNTIPEATLKALADHSEISGASPG
jgi:transaldolase